MKEITYREALREAMAEEMRRDENVFLLGEDIGYFGGAFKVTDGLIAEFGEERVRDTPLAESAISGSAVGAAMVGLRPVAEIMFADFIVLCMDHLVNEASKMRYLYAGDQSVPMVLRAPQGSTGAGAHHSQCIEAWLLNIPGLKIVVPSTPADAKGLLKASIRDNDPVVFIEHRKLYPTIGLVPDGDYVVPIGKADIKREGTNITIIAISSMVPKALIAAEELAKEGISAEVLDPRTLNPLDMETILNSVKKTKNVLTVSEACLTGGPGSEIAARIISEAFDYLDSPIKRIGALDTPVPFSPTMEKFYVPNEKKIIDGVKEVLGY